MLRINSILIITLLLGGLSKAQSQPETIPPQARDIALGLSGGPQAAPAEHRTGWLQYNDQTTGSAITQGLIPPLKSLLDILGSDEYQVGTIQAVSLLGSNAELKWEQTSAALTVQVPDQKTCDHAYTLVITFE